MMKEMSLIQKIGFGLSVFAALGVVLAAPMIIDNLKAKMAEWKANRDKGDE